MKLPYRYRGALLLLLMLFVLPCVVWQYALGDTFRAWRDCRRFASQLAEMPPAAESPLPVRTDSREMILSGAVLDAVRHTATEGNAVVTGYEPLVTSEQDGMAVHTACLTLSGGYVSLLRIVAQLEQRLPQCRIYSLSWRTAADRQTRRKELSATLYIQQIVLKTN